MRTWRSAPSASCTTPASTAPAAAPRGSAQVRNSAQPSSPVPPFWFGWKDPKSLEGSSRQAEECYLHWLSPEPTLTRSTFEGICTGKKLVPAESEV
jgi:hypothetical protein